MQKDVFSICEWCEKKDISHSFFYKLRKQGLGPKVMKVGRRSLITAEADAEWCAQMEAKSSDVEGAK